MTQRFKGEFTHIRQILRRAMSAHGQKQDENLMLIQEMWESCVGREIANQAYPWKLGGGRLLVHVSSSVWHHQLAYLKQDLMNKLNARLGADLVTDIRFKISPI